MNDSIEKKYRKISEVAKMINVNPSTIRFWEREFPWLVPDRKNDRRRYEKEDIEAIKRVNALRKGIGMTLDGVRQAHEYGYEKELEKIIQEVLKKIVMEKISE